MTSLHLRVGIAAVALAFAASSFPLLPHSPIRRLGRPRMAGATSITATAATTMTMMMTTMPKSLLRARCRRSWSSRQPRPIRRLHADNRRSDFRDLSRLASRQNFVTFGSKALR
jgi:hypothetical protein